MVKKIMIVDADVFSNQILGIWLRSLQYEVHIVNDGADARSRADIVRPDLILWELSMLDASGLDMGDWLHACAGIGIPVVCMSTDFDKESDLPDRPAGGVHFFKKPFDLDLMQKTIEATLRSGGKR